MGSRSNAHVLGLLAGCMLFGACRDATAPIKAPSAMRPEEVTGDYVFSPIPALPSQRSAMALVVYGGPCAWSIGGGSQTGTTDEVDTICNTVPPPSNWTVGPSLPQPLSHFAGAGVINGRIYVAGGLDAQGAPVATLYIYSKTTGWRLDAEPLPFRMACGGATVVNGKLYVFGATPPPWAPDATDCVTGIYLDVFAMYDPSRAAPPRWTVLPPEPTHCCRIGGGLAAIGTKIYLTGDSHNSGSPAVGTEVFDTGSNQWLATLPGPPAARFGGGLVSSQGLLYYLGGYNGSFNFDPSNLVHVYDPSIGVWDDARLLTTYRWDVSAAAGGDRIIVLGSDPQPEWHRVGTGPTACDAHEPDNVPQQATTWTIYDQYFGWVVPGRIIHARICSTSDVDLFQIGRGGFQTDFGIRLTPPATGDYRLELLDSTGTIILATADVNGPGMAETIYYTNPLPPNYILRVTSQNGSFDPIRWYTLESLDPP